MSQMSIGFAVLEDKWDIDDQEQLIRTVIKAKLYEVSPVTFPAFTETEVGVRALDGIYGDKPVIPETVRQGPPVSGDREAAEAEAQGRLELMRRRLDLIEVVT